MQVVYHKTVVGLEWSLNECVAELLKRGALHLAKDDIEELVRNGTWHTVDDNYLLVKFSELLASLEETSGSQLICDHLRAILMRRPAKLVFKWEALLEKDDIQAKLKARIIQTELQTIAHDLGIDPRRFNTVIRKPFPFSTSLPRMADGLTYGEQARSVSILEKGKRKSVLLSNFRIR
jgi:uncharacterized protein